MNDGARRTGSATLEQVGRAADRQLLRPMHDRRVPVLLKALAALAQGPRAKAYDRRGPVVL
jgi:hypothetical protein